MELSLAQSSMSFLMKIQGMVRRQWEQIQTGGIRILVRKVSEFVFLLAALPVVLIVRLLRPLILIRFRPLVSDRIGHFAANTEVYLCEKALGMHGKNVFDIFYHNRYSHSIISNLQLKKMWDRTIPTMTFARSIDRANRLFPGWEQHEIPCRDSQHRDIYGTLAKTKTHLSFTPDEELRGQEELKKFGKPEGMPFICFHARDTAYLETLFPDRQWRYLDHRDCKIENVIPAAEEFVRRGYFLIRTGHIVQEPLKVKHPMIFDYASKARTDFMDIYLHAKTHFYLGDPCGINAIPMIFRRPLAMTNLIALENMLSWGESYISLPKKLWLKNEKRFLTFREILDSEIGRFEESQKYAERGIEIIENTAEEILDLAVEMEERLKGTWQTTPEDEELQKKIWSLFKQNDLNNVIRARVGTKFLRQNKGLLA